MDKDIDEPLLLSERLSEVIKWVSKRLPKQLLHYVRGRDRL